MPPGAEHNAARDFGPEYGPEGSRAHGPGPAAERDAATGG